jgi:hypothetical protein
MISNHKFNHTVCGLLSKFIGRNNDYQGYWAPGVLYTEARLSGKRVELDLLAASAQPPSPACAGMARTWAHYLRQALERHGVSPDALAAASISIEFGLPPVPKRPGFVEHGDPFLCSLRLLSRDGRKFVRQEQAHCMPHEEFRGRRSSR